MSDSRCLPQRGEGVVSVAQQWLVMGSIVVTLAVLAAFIAIGEWGE